jgi:queuine tRNA-ribosyltransferase
MPGNAIGGLSVGEPAEMMYEHTALVTEILPKDKPRYLMGVGTPENILECIALGVDMFDCVMPTRNGRNGMLFTTEGIINIKNEKWKFDNSPIDPGLDGFASREYSKSYLRHLFISKEILALQIASIQNLSFYMNLVKEARQKIEEQSFKAWKDEAVRRYMKRL